MAAEDLNLSGIRSLDQAMARTRNGAAAIELAAKLGLWTTGAHARVTTRALFPDQLSELAPTALSDLYARWTSEFGRVAELLGAIHGQEQLLKIQLKSAQASARARVRRANPESKYTQAQLSDLADEDQAVIDLVEQQGLLGVLSAQASAAKEVTLQYLQTISREISFRDAQMKARVYA
jgi:hypothetical protein